MNDQKFCWSAAQPPGRMRRWLMLLALGFTLIGSLTPARATTDYGPAIDRMITGCTKWYTTGYGHKFLVIHDMEGYYLSSISYLSRCDVSASVHYCVNGLKDTSSDAAAGQISQLVREANYSWHASCWNKYSIGTEHEGFVSNPAWYTEAQYQASALLQRHLCDKFGIAKDRNHIVGHNAGQSSAWRSWASANLGIDPTCNSHTDPGQYWDWTHFMELIKGGTDNASFVSKTIADNTVYAPGQKFSSKFTMKNSGTTTWIENAGNGYTFNNNGGTAMGALFATPLAADVAAGNNASFTINFTAPTAAGSYTATFKMNNSDSVYFGSQVSQTIIVGTPPSITAQPVATIKNPGQTATFTVASSGTTPLTYQWKKNGVNLANAGNISGATSATLSIANAQLSDAANYSVVVNNVAGTATSQSAALTVTSTPSAAGTGTGLGAIYFDNLNFTGASVQRTDATIGFVWGTGSPDVAIGPDTFSARWSGKVEPRYSQTYTFYTRTDDGVRLWVNDALLIDKWIGQSATEWSGTIALVAGQQYDLQMEYYENTSTATAELRWSSASQAKEIIPQTQLYPTQPSSSIGPIPGLHNTGVDNNGVLLAAGAVDPHYKLITSADTSASGPNSFVVNEGSYPIPPWPTNGPSSKWIVPRADQSTGSAAGNYTYRLTFNLSGFDPATAVITGNWAADNSGVDIRLNSASTGLSNPNGFGVFTAFIITNGFLPGTNTLDFVINNSGTTTNPTGLRVELSGLTAQAFPALILSSPENQIVNQDGGVTFSAVASGTAPLNYQWQFNGADINGATGTSYTRSNIQTADEGTYSVIVSNAFGSDAASASLVVNVPPSITSQPPNLSVNQGTDGTFIVVPSGTAPFNYQWRCNGTNIPGATANSLTLTNVQPAAAGDYSVVVTNMAGSETSSNATLTVNVPPSIVTEPQNQTALQGTNVTFTVEADGTGPLTYEWRFNGEIISETTGTSFTRTNVQPSDSGDYSVVVMNVAGATVSSNATLTVNVSPSITKQPESLKVSTGSIASFTAKADGSLPLSYQWRFNGTNIPSATATSFTRTNVTAADFGLYSVVASNDFGNATSTEVELSSSSISASMDWYTIDGGGGSSTNGPWTLSGTIGQPDAGPLAGGSWRMAGGFWYDGIFNHSPIAQTALFSRAENTVLQIPISDLLTNASDPDGDFLFLATVSATSTNGATITVSNTFVIYTPASTNANVTDRFTYTVSDTFGARADGFVFITVEIPPPNEPVTIVGINLLPNGNIQMDFSGQADRTYLVQATTNLAPPIIWETVATNTADSNGLFHYLETGAITNYSSRYYRSAVP